MFKYENIVTGDVLRSTQDLTDFSNCTKAAIFFGKHLDTKVDVFDDGAYLRVFEYATNNEIATYMPID